MCRFSIHCQDKKPGELKAAVDSFPLPIEGSTHAFHTGYASEGSYAGTSYLLVREGGNVLVDSPRFDAKLLKNIQVTLDMCITITYVSIAGTLHCECCCPSAPKQT